MSIDLDDERFSTTFPLQDRSMMPLYDYCESIGTTLYALDGILKITIEENIRVLTLIRQLAGQLL
jgi:hypothetical protein